MFATRTFCGFDDGAYVHEYSGNGVQGQSQGSTGTDL